MSCSLKPEINAENLFGCLLMLVKRIGFYLVASGELVTDEIGASLSPAP